MCRCTIHLLRNLWVTSPGGMWLDLLVITVCLSLPLNYLPYSLVTYKTIKSIAWSMHLTFLAFLYTCHYMITTLILECSFSKQYTAMHNWAKINIKLIYIKYKCLYFLLLTTIQEYDRESNLSKFKNKTIGSDHFTYFLLVYFFNTPLICSVMM